MERDHRISDIFYYFQEFTTISTGRTVGRKIGVVQEVLLRKYLDASPELQRRIYLEQSLRGASGASHKVEFSWFAKTTSAALRSGDVLSGADGIRIIDVDERTNAVRLGLDDGTSKASIRVGGELPKTGAVRTHLRNLNVDIRVISVNGDSCTIDVMDRSRPLAALESKRVGAQRFSGSSNLGSGIQTIEKAKQASLVAIDLDLYHSGTIKPLSTAATKNYISLVALGNGVHWTLKDKAVLGTYVDFTYLVRDEAIIRYADYVLSLVGSESDFLSFFMDYFSGMTKARVDDFEVLDEDFSIIAPDSETRTLRQVIEDHIQAVNV